MFSFSKTEIPRKLNKDFILSKITDAQIFGYYFGNFKFGESYPSKFRKDRHPSTGFYVSKSGKLIYNDLAHRNNSYDCFAFVAKMYNLSFSDTIKKIAADFGLITGKPSLMADKAIKALKHFDKTFKEDTKIHFSAAKWNDDNLAFWNQYHITKKELEEDGNYVIKDLFINGFKTECPPGEYRYALTEIVKGEMLTKVYSPGSTNFKWVTNIPTEVPFGLNSLPFKSDFCFTAKAKKDRLVLKKFLTDVIASQSEQKSAMPEKVINKLNFNYKKNYLGWDNDETGMEAMDEMGQHGFIPTFIPVEWGEKYGIKDYSDLSKERGLDAVEKFLKQKNII